MKTLRIYLFAVAAVCCALMLLPQGARADGLTGSADMSWLYPTTSTAFATDTLSVGSSLSCPGASPICAGYSGLGTQTFTLGSTSISYDAAGYPSGDYLSTTFNGFDFSGLTFLSGGTLSGFTLTTNIPGLTSSDIIFGASTIGINLAGLPVNGEFTLDLISSAGATATPEPSSLALLGAGFGSLALMGFGRRRATAHA